MNMPLFEWKPKARQPASPAEKIAQEALLGALPDGVPSPFVEIVSAMFRDRGQIVAEFRMIDGLPATVVFTRWALGWSHRFEAMPGGALSWEGGRWVRLCEEVTP